MLEDPYALLGERRFTSQEDIELLRLYVEGAGVAGIAAAMKLDTKQIATRLIRLLLPTVGSLDNDDEMPRARKRYDDWEFERMRDMYAAGQSLERIAAELGRSTLGVGWRMLDLHIPTVSGPPA